MQTLTVALGERSYPIHIGAGLLERPELLGERLPQKRAAVITNSTGGRSTRAPAPRGCRNGHRGCDDYAPDGEQHKNCRAQSHFDALLENRCERSTTLIAPGRRG